MVVEIQALVVKSEAPAAAEEHHRAGAGACASDTWHSSSVTPGIPMRSHEVYVSVMGGDTGDGASSRPSCCPGQSHRPMRSVPLGQTAAWGEMGLTGET